VKKKILFIVNPVSGVFQKHNIDQKIEDTIDSQHYDYDIQFTEYSGHATILAKEAASNGTDIVVAVGGDGSINEVANGIAYTDVALGVIPLGSGNGYARHLNIPLNVSKALQVINRGKIDAIDIGVTGDQYFISNAGVGFVSIVANEFKQHHLHGFFSYAMAVLKKYFPYRGRTYNIEIDGRAIQRQAFFVVVGNTRELGYHFSATPKADVRDGYFDVLILKPFPKLLGLFTVPFSYFQLTHKWYSSEFHRAKTVKIYQEYESIVELDGDPFPWNESPLKVDVCHLALKVVIP